MDNIYIVTYIVDNKMDKKSFNNMNSSIDFIRQIAHNYTTYQITVQDYCGDLVYKCVEPNNSELEN